MADNIDSIMQGFVNSIISKATAAIAKSNVSGGGVSPGAATVGGAVGAAAASMASAATAQFPPLQAASNLALSTARTTLYGGAPTTAAAASMQRALAQSGTIVSPLDSSIAIQKAASMGFAAGGMNTAMANASTVSNLLPGVGVAGGMQVMAAMQQPQNVNMAKIIGLRLRDANGLPAQIDDVINQIWQQMLRVNGGKPLSKDQVQRSLIPGNALWSMLNMYFGNDPLMQEAIKTGLMAKAGGAKDFSKEELLRVGATTSEVLAQSRRKASGFEFLQSITGGLLKGSEAGTNLGTGITNLVTSLDKLTNIIATISGFGQSVSVGYMAEGGKPGVNKPVVVGEKGPEVFVPSTSGYIVPNHMLPQGNGSSWPAFMEDGGGIPYGTGSDVRRWSTEFLTQLSKKLGTNVNTADNLEAIGRWAQREGGWVRNDAAFNPLDTTFKMSGSWSMNSVGVQGYLSFQDGIDATINTLLGNKADERGYTRIVNALKAGNNPFAVLNAVNKSSWGTHEKNWKAFRTVWDAKTKPREGTIIPGESSGTPTTFDNLTPQSLLDLSSAGVTATTADEIIKSLAARPELGNLLMKANQPTFGKRRSGGHVSAGVPYTIGENGPEKFVPTGYGGGVNYGGVTIHIHEVPATMTEEALVREIKNALSVENITRRAATE